LLAMHCVMHLIHPVDAGRRRMKANKNLNHRNDERDNR